MKHSISFTLNFTIKDNSAISQYMTNFCSVIVRCCRGTEAPWVAWPGERCPHRGGHLRAACAPCNCLRGEAGGVLSDRTWPCCHHERTVSFARVSAVNRNH